jgi:hypothetical protein
MYRAYKGRANSHANNDCNVNSRNTCPAYPDIANTMITDIVSFGIIYFFCLLWAMNPPIKSRHAAEINIPLLEDWK